MKVHIVYDSTWEISSAHSVTNFDIDIDHVNPTRKIHQLGFSIFYDFSINCEIAMSPLFSIFEPYSTIMFFPLKNTTIF